MIERPLLLECPDCAARFHLKKHRPEKRIRCRKCKHVMIIPPLPGGEAEAEARTLQPDRNKKLRRIFRLPRLFLASGLLIVAVGAAAYVLGVRIRWRPTVREEKLAEGPMTFEKLRRENAAGPFPLAIGYAWTYEAASGRKAEFRIVASHLGPTDEPQFDAVRAQGEAGARQLLRATNEGPYLLEERPLRGERITYDPPLLVVPRPLFTETEWRYDGEVTQGGVTEIWRLFFKVEGIESLTTVVGTMSCLRVRVTGKKGKAIVDETRWIALGIGEVKWKSPEGEFVLRKFHRP